ncbi:energy transducer TonB [Colwellia echini]|nr:energy transducer TonB [Colwellia echini]
MLKHIGILCAAAIFALMVFAGMQLMIANDGVFTKKDKNQANLNFVRVDSNKAEVTTKDRRMPEPPPPPESKPDVPSSSAQISDNSSPSMAMSMPKIGMSMNTGSGPFLGTLQQGGGMAGFDTDVIPIVRVPAAYPQRARQAKLSGYVTMEVLIRPDGTVSDVKVVDAKPPRLFDSAAINAMKRWKFRPKTVDGKPQSQRAQQTIEFSLAK